MRISILILLLFATVSNLYAQTFESAIFDWQQNYKQGFINDAHSPLSAADTSFIDFFPIDSSYCVSATITIFNKPVNVIFPTSGTKTKEFERYAQLDFVLNDTAYSLVVFQSNKDTDSNYLFLPFVDASAGNTSYGGGRYIDLDKRNIKDGVLVLDFNKAYNPYCAYATGYNCPLPPRENNLNTAILAGEKTYVGKKKNRPDTNSK